MRKQRETKGKTEGKEKQGRGQKRKEGRNANKNVEDEVRMEGSAELTSIWFNILLYSVLRASRVTRTRPS